jgi:hypothetical protein
VEADLSGLPAGTPAWTDPPAATEGERPLHWPLRDVPASGLLLRVLFEQKR